MRYVFLLIILCLGFFALNSVTRYSRPLSFLSTGSAAPVSGNAYSAHKHSTESPSSENSSNVAAGSLPAKGGPSEGFGLGTASAANGGAKTLDNASDAGAIGNVASAELAPAPIASPKTLVNRSMETASPRVEKIVPTALATAALLPSRSSAPTASSVSASSTNSITTTNNEVSEAKTEAPASDAAVTTTESTTSSEINLESAVSLDADFLELAPVPDAVQVQPAAAPFALSAQSEAFALHIADSIRNSLMDPHGIQFGGIAGLNWSGASATNTTGKVSGSPLMGFNLGFFADIPVEKKLSVRPELLYSFEGYQPDVNGQRINVHVAYLTMPIDLVYHTNWFNKRIYVGAGPYAAYGLSGTYTMKGIDTDMQFGNNYANGDNLRKVDLGANFMAGVLLDRNFIIGAKFDLGLSNIASGGSSSQIHTRSFGLSIGYVFRNKANTKTL